MAIFGQNEFGARIYTALCALLTIAVVGWLAAKLWDRATAWRAVFALSGMGLFVVLGQLLTLDMSLAFYLTVALAGFLWAQHAPAARRGMLAIWVAVAFGVMTKGLVAAVIPAAVLVLYSLLTRDFGPWRRLHLRLGLPVFLLLTVPWYWLAAKAQPDFLEFFFVHEHFARYLTPSANREEPWWFFGVVFLAGSLPWSIGAVRALSTGWRRTSPAFDARRFLWVWMLFIGVFFSLSDSKLIPYILPVMPALALLLATGDAAARRVDVIAAGIVSIAAAIALAIVCLEAPRLLSHSARDAYFLALAPPLRQIAAVLVASGLFVLVSRNRNSTRGFVFLGFGWCLATLLAMRAAVHVAGIYSGATLVPAFADVPVDTPLYSVGTYDQTLPFYLKRTVTLVSYSGELSFGLAHSSNVMSLDIAAFVARWRGEPRAFAVMGTDMFDRLKSEGVPMREIARDARQVAVARE